MSPRFNQRGVLRTQSRLPVITLQLGLLLLLVYYIVNDGRTGLGGYDFSRRAIVQWVGIALIAAWLIWRLLNPGKIFKSPLDMPLLWLLLASLLATIFSVNFFISLEAVIFFFIYFFFFLLAVDLARHLWLVEIVINAMLGAAAIVILRSLLLMILFGNISTIPLPRLAAWGTAMGDPNRLAVYLGPIICLAFYKLTISSRWVGRVLLTALVVLFLVALALTQSRGGLLGFMAIITCYGVAWFSRKGLKIQSGVKTRKVKVLIVIVIFILIGVSSFIIGSRDIGLQSIAIQTRLETITGAIKTLAAHPLVGSGPGTLGQEMLRYQPPLYGVHAHAHILFLTFAAETGLLGIIGMAWLAIVVVRQLWSTTRERESFRQDSLRIGLTAALVGFVAHSIIDSFFEFPVGISLMAILFGFWAGIGVRQQPLSPSWARGINITASVVLVIVVVFGLPITRGTRAYNQAVLASYIGDWKNTINHLQKAIALSPPTWIYFRQLGFAYGYLARENPLYRDQAIIQYKEALQAMDQLPSDHANLSCLLWENGDHGQAIQAMTRARNLDPDNALYQLNLGRYLEAQYRYDEAWDEYAQFISEQPAYLHSSYWQQTRPRRDNLSIILTRAVDRLIETQGEDSIHLANLYTEAGYLTEGLRIYNELQPTTDELANIHLGRAKVLLAMQKLDQALAELEAAIALRPDLALAYQYRGNIYLQQGRLDEAYHDTQLALSMAPSAASYYQRGQIAEAQGNIQEALQQYDIAIAQAQTLPHFRTLYNVAVETLTRRVPLAEEHLPCLEFPYITDDLVLPTLAKENLLER